MLQGHGEIRLELFLLTSEHKKSNPATGGLLSVVGCKVLRMINHLWLIIIQH